ncbi:DUF3105 domain-containing protein [Nocardioides limicola]|uniref:DUF3105 domain-containing protein n=1 Tax=Nocardioides limicola TaxID=2803368 RepID=UPI00193C3F69|nr:DUF3105 domain-containing protein [Nocardioides sp. DJM-14]
MIGTVVGGTVLAGVLLLRAGVPAGSAAQPLVVEYEDLPVDHQRGTIDYPQGPPVGGPHNATWLTCGVYDAPVPNELMVHSLEHGTLWLTYRPGLSQAQIDTLADLAGPAGVVSPYPGQDGDVVATVWGRQLHVSHADHPALTDFVARYGDGHTAPEPWANCFGGVSPAEGWLLVGRASA